MANARAVATNPSRRIMTLHSSLREPFSPAVQESARTVTGGCRRSEVGVPPPGTPPRGRRWIRDSSTRCTPCDRFTTSCASLVVGDPLATTLSVINTTLSSQTRERTMRKHHKRWAALAGMTAASLTGFGLLGGASATADDREELPWPVIQQRVSSYSLDGFQITDLPSGLDGYAIKARSFTNGTGERQAEISWVQGPESVYGKVSVLRSEKFRSLEDLRDRNYDHLSRGSLKKVQVNGKDADLAATSGDLFRLEEPGVAVTVFLQPDRWETKALLGFAESVRPQRAAQGDTGAPADKPAEKPADKPAEKPAAEADKPAEKPAAEADKPAEKPAEKPAAEAEKPAEEPAEKPAEKPAAEADKPAEKPAEKPAAETEQGPEAGESQQDGAPAPERPAGQ